MQKENDTRQTSKERSNFLALAYHADADEHLPQKYSLMRFASYLHRADFVLNGIA